MRENNHRYNVILSKQTNCTHMSTVDKGLSPYLHFTINGEKRERKTCWYRKGFDIWQAGDMLPFKTFHRCTLKTCLRTWEVSMCQLTFSGKLSNDALSALALPKEDDLYLRIKSCREAATRKYSCLRRSSLPSNIWKQTHSSVTAFDDVALTMTRILFHLEDIRFANQSDKLTVEMILKLVISTSLSDSLFDTHLLQSLSTNGQ